MWLTQIKWFVLFLARAFAPTSNDCIWSFSSQPLISCSMAAKWSDLGDEMSGVNLQMEGHVDVPPQSAKDLQELEALDSSPSHLPSWSPAQRLLSSCPNTKHCLEIHVTLTEELGAVTPPSHSWMPPSWKTCYVMLGPDSPQQWLQAQVGQFFFMGDIQWQRA